MKKERSVSLDLLRIICTLMVVCNHFISWGGLLGEDIKIMTPSWMAVNTFFVFLLPAVNCFVLISGYFLCTETFRFRKLALLWIQAAFYSVGIYILVCLFDKETSFSIIELAKNFLVVTMERYWYVTAYVLLYIVFPFLNCAIHGMNQKLHALCCVVLLGVFSVLPNLVYIVDFTGVHGGYTFLWFCVVYIVAAYFRLYVPNRITHQKWMFAISALCALIICGEKFAAYIITPHIFGSVKLDGFFYSYNSIVAVPCALTLFQGFRGLKITSNLCTKLISFFAPLMFAAYLIHSHPSFIEPLLSAFNVKAYENSVALFPYMIACTFAVVIGSALVEWLRQQLFARLKINCAIRQFCDDVQERVQRWLNEEEKKTCA